LRNNAATAIITFDLTSQFFRNYCTQAA